MCVLTWSRWIVRELCRALSFGPVAGPAIQFSQRLTDTDGLHESHELSVQMTLSSPSGSASPEPASTESISLLEPVSPDSMSPELVSLGPAPDEAMPVPTLPSRRFQRAALTHEAGIYSAVLLRNPTAGERDYGEVLLSPSLTAMGDASTLSFPASPRLSGQNKWEFDRIFDVKHTNREVFELVKPRVEAALAGYDEAIVADGYSGSGKTWTLLNGPDAVIRAVYDMLVTEGQAVRIEYTVVECHHLGLRDLSSYKPVGIERLEQAQRMKLARGEGDLKTCLQFASVTREIEATPLNPHSSRSHLCLTLYIRQDDFTESHLIFADLAGSEPHSSEVSRETTAFINRSRGNIRDLLRGAPYRPKQFAKRWRPEVGTPADYPEVLALTNIIAELAPGCMYRRSPDPAPGPHLPAREVF